MRACALCCQLALVFFVGCRRSVSLQPELRPLHHFESGYEVIPSQGVIRVWMANTSGRDIFVQVGNTPTEPMMSYIVQYAPSGDEWYGAARDHTVWPRYDIRLRLVPCFGAQGSGLSIATSRLDFDIPWMEGPERRVSNLTIRIRCVELQEFSHINTKEDLLDFLEKHEQEYLIPPHAPKR